MDKIFLFFTADECQAFCHEELIVAHEQLEIASQQRTSVNVTLKFLHQSLGEEGISPDTIVVNDISITDAIPSNVKDFDPKKQNIHLENRFELLSEKLHEVLDQCFILGRTKFFIYWVINQDVPDIKNVLELYGAFERLHLWCNAVLNIISPNVEALDGWLSVLPFRVSSTCNEVVKQDLQTFWNGNVVFPMVEEMQLTLQFKNSLSNHTQSFLPFSPIISGMKDLYVDNSAEIYEKVLLSSIPWLSVVTGGNCLLKPPNHKHLYAESFSNLHSHINQSNVGFLMRIKYSFRPIRHSPERLSLETWEQCAGDVSIPSAPQFSFDGAYQTQVFLLVAEGSNPKQVTAIALQDLNNYSPEVLELLSSDELLNSMEDMPNSLPMTLYKESPMYGPVFMGALSYLVDNVPSMFEKHVASTGKNVHEYNIETRKHIECLFSSSYFKHLFLSKQRCPEIITESFCIQPEIKEDKEKWPVYRALKESEKNNQCNDLLSPPTKSNFLMDAGYITKCFTKDGNPIESSLKNFTKLYPQKKSNQLLENLSDAVSKGWPKCLLTNYHGISYHTTKDSPEIVEKHVANETESTCSMFQKKVDTNQRRNKENSSRGSRTPTKSRIASSVSDSPSRNLRSHKYNNFVNRAKLRRSPRKKVQSATMSKVNAGASTSKNRKSLLPELSNLHTQKLRNAVMNSLEGEGITVKDSIFKSCFKKLFAVCKPFAIDVIGLGSTSRNMEKIAKSHVTQVIEFEKTKLKT